MFERNQPSCSLSKAETFREICYPHLSM